MTTPEPVAQLNALIRGLWFPSETEAPWTLPTWKLQSMDIGEICRSLRRVPDVAVSQITLEQLLQQVTRRCQGYGDEGIAIAQQHHALANYLNHCCETITVFRVGQVTIDILIVGQVRVEDSVEYVLLQTQSVET